MGFCNSPWDFVVHFITLLLISIVVSGCQIPYLMKNAYEQIHILNKRTSIQNILINENIDKETKRKLTLAIEAKNFAETELQLNPSKNYHSFVHLDRPYVTYVLSASPKWELNHYLWKYPFLGTLPYRGYFNEKNALEEEESLKKENLDTYIRGVTAYSSLGWFDDPIYSSMLSYEDHDFVSTIIHELVHSTIYIKSEADFNERLATFISNIGTEIFYLKKEGPQSLSVKKIRNENEDEKIFSKFISKEINDLEGWYKTNKSPPDFLKRESRLTHIVEQFKKYIWPQLKTNKYEYFKSIKLNNAKLLIYKTYLMDLSDLELLFEKKNKNFKDFLNFCKNLENEKNPESIIKNLSENSSDE